MGNEAVALAERYQEALRIGDRLLALLQGPMSDGKLDEVERLVQARQQALRQTDGIVRPGVFTPDAREALERLVAQQRVLEDQMRRTVADLRQTAVAAHQTHQDLKAFRRVISPGGRSQRLDQRR